MDLELRGKKVLITGGSKGIGLGCAQVFAAEGARVQIASRSQPDLKAAADAIAKKYNTEVAIHPMDLGNSSRRRIATRPQPSFGRFRTTRSNAHSPPSRAARRLFPDASHRPRS